MLNPRNWNWNAIGIVYSMLSLAIALYLFFIVGSWTNYLQDQFVTSQAPAAGECDAYQQNADTAVSTKAGSLGITIDPADISSYPYLFRSTTVNSCVAVFTLAHDATTTDYVFDIEKNAELTGGTAGSVLDELSEL